MGKTVSVPEHCSLQTATHLHEGLCQAFEQPDPIELDLDALVEGDLSLIQLLVAARATANAAGRALSLARPANPALAALLERSGLVPGCPDEITFWFHGEARQ